MTKKKSAIWIHLYFISKNSICTHLEKHNICTFKVIIQLFRRKCFRKAKKSASVCFFSAKGHTAPIWGFAGHTASTSTIQPCWCESSHTSSYLTQWSWLCSKYLLTKISRWMGPSVHSLRTPALGQCFPAPAASASTRLLKNANS